MSRRSRYSNVKKVEIDGITFDSQREAKRYGELKLLQKAGEIWDLKVHPRYPIILGGVKILMKSERYPNGRQAVYVADFSYVENTFYEGCAANKVVIEDVKMQSGHRTEVYKIKRALMDAMGVPITEY